MIAAGNVLARLLRTIAIPIAIIKMISFVCFLCALGCLADGQRQSWPIRLATCTREECMRVRSFAYPSGGRSSICFHISSPLIRAAKWSDAIGKEAKKTNQSYTFGQTSNLLASTSWPILPMWRRIYPRDLQRQLGKKSALGVSGSICIDFSAISASVIICVQINHIQLPRPLRVTLSIDQSVKT